VRGGPASRGRPYPSSEANEAPRTKGSSPRARAAADYRRRSAGWCARVEPGSTSRMPRGEPPLTPPRETRTRSSRPSPRCSRTRIRPPSMAPLSAAPGPSPQQGNRGVVGTRSTPHRIPLSRHCYPSKEWFHPPPGSRSEPERPGPPASARRLELWDGPTGPCGPANPSPRHRCPRPQSGAPTECRLGESPSPSPAARTPRPRRSGRCCRPSRS
jgi:hypothetical protein